MPEDATKELADLDRWLAERNLRGLWSRTSRQREECKPYLWKWADVHECVLAAADAVPMELVDRRVLTLLNPSLGNGTISTMRVSIQCLKPGEVATAHRHSAGAIRFILQGPPGVTCVVEGMRVPIGDGDLLTTPSMTWHDHYSEAKSPAIWLDALDNRLVGKMGKRFGDKYQSPQQPITLPDGFGAQVLNGTVPPWFASELPSPPFRYPWEETYDTLRFLQQSEIEPDPYDGTHVVFAHPITGGPTMSTYSCEMQLLTVYEETKAHRHNSSTVYQAYRGEGVTEIDGERYEWTQGDIFVVPPWSWHRHLNTSNEDALLFSLSDRAAMEAIGLYREELGD